MPALKRSAPTTRLVGGTSIAIAAVFLCAAFGAGQDHPQPVMRIYYLPFAIQTDAPVTKSDIEEASSLRLILGRPAKLSPFQPDNPLIARLQAILRARPATQRLREDFIRLKVVTEWDLYYVDNKGTVLEQATGRTFRLTKNEMDNIDAQISSLRGVVDIDVPNCPPCRISK
jgi:hypothetical protein